MCISGRACWCGGAAPKKTLLCEQQVCDADCTVIQLHSLCTLPGWMHNDVNGSIAIFVGMELWFDTLTGPGLKCQQAAVQALPAACWRFAT
jgi:hypothetical protein